jgi:SAM-dependent methyltransferase
MNWAEDRVLVERRIIAAVFSWGERRMGVGSVALRGQCALLRQGRLPYPEEIALVLHRELAFDGSGRLLDVGCGPGSLTLVLSGLFDEVVGIDADAGMIEEARAVLPRSGAPGGAESEEGIGDTPWDWGCGHTRGLWDPRIRTGVPVVDRGSERR